MCYGSSSSRGLSLDCTCCTAVHICSMHANLYCIVCMQCSLSRLCLLLHHAGPLFNCEGVLLHVGATIIWSDGRRANFQCAFDQALTQYLEVSLLTPHSCCGSLYALLYSTHIYIAYLQEPHKCQTCQACAYQRPASFGTMPQQHARYTCSCCLTQTQADDCGLRGMQTQNPMSLHV